VRHDSTGRSDRHPKKPGSFGIEPVPGGGATSSLPYAGVISVMPDKHPPPDDEAGRPGANRSLSFESPTRSPACDGVGDPSRFHAAVSEGGHRGSREWPSRDRARPVLQTTCCRPRAAVALRLNRGRWRSPRAMHAPTPFFHAPHRQDEARPALPSGHEPEATSGTPTVADKNGPLFSN
jgi:hypothetical protein